MNIREQKIRLWFDMWLQKMDLGIEDLFSADAVYIESWGPEYAGIKKDVYKRQVYRYEQTGYPRGLSRDRRILSPGCI